jgi:hypothetical protein
MKKKSILMFFIIILLFSCKKSNVNYNWDNINSIVEDCVFSFIDQEKIYYTTASSWGTTDYGKNVDKMYIDILFNQGNYKNEIIYNNDIENNIINKIFNTFSILNHNKNKLQIENVKIFVFYPFKIIYPMEVNYSEEEKEYINSLSWEEFEMDKIINIYENYCDGYLETDIDLNKFINFMKKHFGNDIIIEM